MFELLTVKRERPNLIQHHDLFDTTALFVRLDSELSFVKISTPNVVYGGQSCKNSSGSHVAASEEN